MDLNFFLSLHLDINPCSSSPCENGGTCVNTIDGNYTCVYETQWTGSNCEVGEYFVSFVSKDGLSSPRNFFTATVSLSVILTLVMHVK